PSFIVTNPSDYYPKVSRGLPSSITSRQAEIGCGRMIAVVLNGTRELILGRVEKLTATRLKILKYKLISGRKYAPRIDEDRFMVWEPTQGTLLHWNFDLGSRGV